MNVVMAYTKHLGEGGTAEWKKIAKFVGQLLSCVACCLRLDRSIAPFLKDSKNYFLYILKILKSNITNQDLTLKCLNVIKQLLVDEECTAMVLKQFQSLTIFLLQIIDYNQKNYDIVRVSITCFKVILSGGRALDKERNKRILADVLKKPQLKSLNALAQQMKTKANLRTQEDLIAELNKDIFTSTTQLPSHVTIQYKFLIKIEKYLKVIKSKYDRDKKALADKSYFTREQDLDIEMDEDPDRDED